MNLLITFENPHSTWSPLHIYKKFFEWILCNYPEFNIQYENTHPIRKMNPSGPHSPQLMTIRNLDNRKYIIISYWDRAIELTWEGNGWDEENRVDLITSSGVFSEMNFTPFSYCCYSSEFELLADSLRKKFIEKENKDLLFRGYLYHHRKMMQNYRPEFFSEERKSTIDYFNELNDSKICMSLDGVGEICNRDLEILCCGSVLLRPELYQKFHNPLIPDYHYISVEKVDDPSKQLDLLVEKFNSVRHDEDYLSEIAKNGLEWYLNNGSIDSNVELLKKIVNINKLT